MTKYFVLRFKHYLESDPLPTVVLKAAAVWYFRELLLVIPLLTLICDLLQGMISWIGNALRRRKREMENRKREKLCRERVARIKEMPYSAQDSGPPPKTKIDLAGEAHADHQDDLAIAEMVEDEDLRDIMIAQAGIKYRNRLIELMEQA